ncbi:beta-phosphoglucomutase [Undibacterium sp. TJN19]|uniref:beta-phosphoglucomutase n=1 Tax=Undibacterium sp. TJN19 TaxID=3413055 RepID=UPI003BF1C135
MLKYPYRAVIFDLDGVLTDTAHYHYLAWKQIADEVGAFFDETVNEQLKGVDRMGSLNLILAASGKHFTEDEKLDLAVKKNLHYQQLIAHISPDDLLPGAALALQAIRDAGLKTALASVSKNAQAVIEKLGISQQFDAVADAAFITHSKPHPEIFLTAAAHLGVDPQDCLGVEDSIAGIRAIRSAHMFALGIGSPTVLTEANVVIAGLHEFNLHDYLKRDL